MNKTIQTNEERERIMKSDSDKALDIIGFIMAISFMMMIITALLALWFIPDGPYIQMLKIAGTSLVILIVAFLIGKFIEFLIKEKEL